MGQVTIQGQVYEIYGEHKGADSADVYFKGSASASLWAAIDSTSQKRLLVETARVFDRQNWKGTITDPTTPQPLAHPRIGLIDREGQAVDQNTIAPDVITGSYEYALEGDANPALFGQASTGDNNKRLKAGSVEIEKFRPTRGVRFPTKVQELVSPFLDIGDRFPGIASGTDGVPAFDENTAGLWTGYA